MVPFNAINRRGFLKALAGSAAAAGFSPQTLLAEENRPPRSWQNWSGNQHANPARQQYLRDEAALIDVLQSGSGTVRPFGGSHSFSPLVPTDDTLVSLEALSGARGRDGTMMRYGGGTRLAMASKLAYNQGLSFTNEPDINLQSLAGAIATATHGTGLALPSLSGQVANLRLITPQGEPLELSEKDGDRFLAACCHLGALGVVTEVGFHHQPAYRLEEHTWTLPLDEAMEFAAANRDRFRHLELFAFPLGETAIVKTLEITDNPDDSGEREDSNDLLETVCELSMRAGWLTPTLQKLVTLFVSESRFRGPSHQVFANSRAVRFNEMEYTVPAEQGLACLQEVCETLRRQDINAFFPIEFRYAGAEAPLLSMYHQRAGASLSIHQYAKQDYRPLFQAVEPILQRYQGRPHWGKIHSLGREQLRELYPSFDRFQAVRRELDPKGRMLNTHLKKLFA